MASSEKPSNGWIETLTRVAKLTIIGGVLLALAVTGGLIASGFVGYLGGQMGLAFGVGFFTSAAIVGGGLAVASEYGAQKGHNEAVARRLA